MASKKKWILLSLIIIVILTLLIYKIENQEICNQGICNQGIEEGNEIDSYFNFDLNAISCH